MMVFALEFINELSVTCIMFVVGIVRPIIFLIVFRINEIYHKYKYIFNPRQT